MCKQNYYGLQWLVAPYDKVTCFYPCQMVLDEVTSSINIITNIWDSHFAEKKHHEKDHP